MRRRGSEPHDMELPRVGRFEQRCRELLSGDPGRSGSARRAALELEEDAPAGLARSRGSFALPSWSALVDAPSWDGWWPGVLARDPALARCAFDSLALAAEDPRAPARSMPHCAVALAACCGLAPWGRSASHGRSLARAASRAALPDGPAWGAPCHLDERLAVACLDRARARLDPLGDRAWREGFDLGWDPRAGSASAPLQAARERIALESQAGSGSARGSGASRL